MLPEFYRNISSWRYHKIREKVTNKTEISKPFIYTYICPSDRNTFVPPSGGVPSTWSWKCNSNCSPSRRVPRVCLPVDLLRIVTRPSYKLPSTHFHQTYLVKVPCTLMILSFPLQHQPWLSGTFDAAETVITKLSMIKKEW